MKKVIIIGAGAHAAEIEEYILENNTLKFGTEIEILGYLDDSELNYKKSQLLFPLLGGIFSFEVSTDVELILSLGNIALRSRIITHFTEKKSSLLILFIILHVFLGQLNWVLAILFVLILNSALTLSSEITTRLITNPVSDMIR